MKTVTILRGVPGCGKSSFAEYISDEKTEIICADDYFMVDGEYKYDKNHIKDAHSWCHSRFLECLKIEVQNIIIANTSTSEWEFKNYKELAEKNDYRVFVVIVENRHNGKNTHGCPEESVKVMENRLRNSIKLL